MGNLMISAAAFILLHRVISGSPLRSVIVGRIGEVAYGRLFQLATVAALVWLGSAYVGATASNAVQTLWNPNPFTLHCQIALQLLALFLITTGFTTPNPATFRQEAVAERPDAVQGILRVTRHPFLWGVALFAAGHIMAAPTARNLILFGTLLFVSLTGTLSIDAKRRRSLGSKWTAFAAQTSNLPFFAIATGRQAFRLRELAWTKLGAALAIYVVLILTHSAMVGRSAIP